MQFFSIGSGRIHAAVASPQWAISRLNYDRGFSSYSCVG